MSIVTDEITTIEAKICQCLDGDSPIDSVTVKRLHSLRIDHIRELTQQHASLLADRNQRMEIMKDKTKQWTAKTIGIDTGSHPDIVSRIHEEQDKYDMVAVHWVENESGDWIDSEASSIAAGILFLINEIC